MVNEDIKFWRGKPVNTLTLDELRQALAEVYRELERLTWLAHQQKKIIEKGGKGKKGRAKLTLVENEDEAHAA